jgi:hypothetical protein
MRLTLPCAAAVALLIPSIVLTVGCAKKTIVGKWTGSIEYPMLGNVTANIEYKEGGAMTQTATTPRGQVEVTGTYKAEGENLTLAVTDVKLGGNSVMGLLPPAAKSNLNKTVAFKLDGETLTLTEKGQSQTFTRVKE